MQCKMVTCSTSTQRTGNVMDTAQPQKRYCEVSETSQHLRSGFRSGLMTVLIEGHVSDVMRAVLYAPMSPVKCQESFFICLPRGERGNTVDRFCLDFAGFEIGSFPFNFEDLSTVRECEVIIEESGCP